MRQYQDDIPGYRGGPKKKIVILESMQEGFKVGDTYIAKNKYEGASLTPGWEKAKKEIVNGDPKLRDRMKAIAEKLAEEIIAANPSLSTGYQGLERSEDGHTVVASLALAGEERFMLRRRQNTLTVKPGAGDGAYRIIINTDVPWWGDPTANAGVLGALVLVLQNFGPVEIWIQQGWIRNHVADDGVTLFKLDYGLQFEPAHLAFWIGSRLKDRPFSYTINKGLGRVGSGCSYKPQVPCDVYIHGCFMGSNAPYDYNLMNKDQREKYALSQAVAWVTKTAADAVFEEGAEALTALS